MRPALVARAMVRVFASLAILSSSVAAVAPAAWAQAAGPGLRVTVNDLPPFDFPPAQSPVQLPVDALQPIHID